MSDATSCNVRVMVRFRPVNEREKSEMLKAQNFSLQFPTLERVEMKNGDNSHSFAFDRVYDTKVTQADVYKTCAEAVVADVLNGYNGTIFAYGQTGSGKTFTMYGPDNPTPELIGIVPRASRQIFQHIQNDKRNVEYSIRAGFVEIYKEKVLDLLRPSDQDLKIRESPQKGVWIEGLGEEFVSCEEDILELIAVGERHRSVAATKMNERSSRSHSLFMITIEQKNLDDGSTKSGKMNLVDLAGSEKIAKTGAEGNTLEEAKKINQSLSALGNCIHALTEAKRGHVPFRDSKLTRILQESLGGNTKTTLMITASPHPFNAEETISSLKFGQRAKTIKTNVSVNQQKSVAELMLLVETLKAELTALRAYASRLEKIVAYMRSPDYDPTKPLPAHLTLPEKAPASAPAPTDAGSSSAPVPMAPSSSNPSPSADESPRAPSPQPRSSDSGKGTPERRGSSRGSAITPSPAKAKGSSEKRLSTVGVPPKPAATPPPIATSPSMTNLLLGVDAFDSFAESRMELAKLKESSAREITELNDKLETVTTALEEKEALVKELQQKTQGGHAEASDLRGQLDTALAEAARLSAEKTDILNTRNAELDNVRTQLNITKAAVEASEARVAALQAELVQVKVTNERVMHQLGALSSLHNTDVLHATNLKEQVQLYAGEVPNTDADTLEQLRAKYEHLYTNVFGQIAEHKAASIARYEETLKLKDAAETETRLRQNAEQAAKEYQNHIAATDKKIAEGEAEIRALHAKLASAAQERARFEKEVQAAKKEAENERAARKAAEEEAIKLRQLLQEAESRRSRVFRAIRAGETNEDRARRLGRPLNAFEEKLDYGQILGQLRKTGLKPEARDP